MHACGVTQGDSVQRKYIRRTVPPAARRSTMNRFPKFGQSLRRPFAVAEECYNCAELYDGCNTWPASKPFRCADYNPLPDVGIDGNTGQVFPPPRIEERKVPRELPSTPAPKLIEQPKQTTPQEDRPARTADPKPRTCGCGAALSNGKRLCNTCRTAARRRTVREYMRRRRSGPVHAGPDVPLSAFSVERTQRSVAKRGPTRPTGGGAPRSQTSVLQTAR